MLQGIIFMLAARTGILRLLTRLMLDGRVPLALKTLPVLAVIYVVSPFDILPDIIPVTGWADDLVVILLSAALFLGLAPREVVREHLGGRRPGGPNTIDGSFRRLDDEEPRA